MIDWERVGREAADFLSQLIQVDTSNPPGITTEAAELVADKLDEVGVKYEIITPKDGKTSLVARVKGGEGPKLLLLSHLDVVPAKEEDWRYPPFSGRILDNYVWGRGAIDDKGHVAVELFALLQLLQRDVELRGDIIFAATADEEVGGTYGVRWIVENEPSKLEAEYAINEGGGLGVKLSKGTIFSIQTSEKGVYWFKMRFLGRPGHASMPKSGENAIMKMNKFLTRMERRETPLYIHEHVRRYIRSLGKASGKGFFSRMLTSKGVSKYALKMVEKWDKSIAIMLDAMMKNTIAPTVVKGGTKENIIPDEVELRFDCRLLPGFDEKFVEEYVKKVAGDIDYQLEFIHTQPASFSELDTPLYKAIERTLGENIKDAILAPYLSTGATDSRFIRWKYNTCAYGFHPILADMKLSEFLKMVHGVDERISVKNIEFGAKITYEVLEEFIITK